MWTWHHDLTPEMAGHAIWPPQSHIPTEERCWRCEKRRLHGLGSEDECAAGLCETCCEELKQVA